jgi:hypothetical protein
MKSKLYDVVQQVCDRIRDTAGQRRIVVKKNDHATYLDDSEEEEEDFFAEGSKKIVAMNNKEREMKTADDRLKEREKTAQGSGLFGWLGLW